MVRAGRAYLPAWAPSEGQLPWIGLSDSTLVERRRLDAQRAEVDVALAAVVDLVVDDIGDQPVDRAGETPKGGVDLVEALQGKPGPQPLDLLCFLIPTCQYFRFGGRLRRGERRPVACNDATQGGHG